MRTNRAVILLLAITVMYFGWHFMFDPIPPPVEQQLPYPHEVNKRGELN